MDKEVNIDYSISSSPRACGFCFVSCLHILVIPCVSDVVHYGSLVCMLEGYSSSILTDDHHSFWLHHAACWSLTSMTLGPERFVLAGSLPSLIQLKSFRQQSFCELGLLEVGIHGILIIWMPQSWPLMIFEDPELEVLVTSTWTKSAPPLPFHMGVVHPASGLPSLIPAQSICGLGSWVGV